MRPLCIVETTIFENESAEEAEDQKGKKCACLNFCSAAWVSSVWLLPVECPQQRPHLQPPVGTEGLKFKGFTEKIMVSIIKIQVLLFLKNFEPNNVPVNCNQNCGIKYVVFVSGSWNPSWIRIQTVPNSYIINLEKEKIINIFFIYFILRKNLFLNYTKIMAL